MKISKDIFIRQKNLQGKVGQSDRLQMISGQQDELRKLKTELRRVTEERNILKEAAAYFASESRKNTHS